VRLLSLLLPSAALVNVFPTLHEIGACMGSNYQHWGQRRVLELTSAASATATAAAPATGAAGAACGKTEEVTKLEERLQKFKDKMAFVATLQGMPQRKRISFQKK
jgi:flagellar motor component MotA